MGGSDIGSKYDFSDNCEEDVSDCYLELIFQIASWTLLCIPIIIIAADVWSAFRKKKHWIPADSLVLGALALQLLGLLNDSVDFSGTFYGRTYPHDKSCTDLRIFHYYWVSVVSGRVSVCVLMGCLLPGVARPLSSNLWSDMSALIISSSVSLFQISYEAHRLYTAFRKCGGGIIGRREFVSMQMVNITILVLIIFLLLLLVCAALANASMRHIVSPKIPTIFFLPNCHTHFAWEKVGEHLTKSWIVIRTSDPQYIIARTCLTSSVALVITICNVIFVRQVPNVRGIYELGNQIEFGLRSGFIAVGSTVIYWRWITAVVYYPASLGRKRSNLSQYFQIEEFWKSHLLGLIHESNGRGHNERRSCLAKLFMSLSRVMRLHKLLHVLLWIQMFSILFSKVCCLVSQLFLSNKIFGRLLIRSDYEEFSYLYGRKNRREKQLGEGSDYDTYFTAIVNMQGENSAGLWIANRKSIRQIKKQMKKGEEEGKIYSELISFLRNKCSPDFIGEKCVKPRNDHFAILEVEREFDVRKCSWKMTAVSLIAVILELSPFLSDNVEASNMVDRAIEACSQAWNIVEVVENYDKEAIGFAKAADKIFESLKKSKKWLEYSLPLNRRVDRSPAAAKEAIENLVEKGKQIANQYSSRGWSDAMVGLSLYRVGGIIKNSEFDNVDTCFDGISSMLADVIGSCTVKATGVIMEDCKKLATMSDEENIWRIARLAGKVKGVIENVGWKLKWSTDTESRFINTSLQREEIRAFRKHPTFQFG